MRFIRFFLVLLPIQLLAQPAEIREVIRPIKTYPFSDPDPVPRPGRTYPYFRFDGFTNTSEMVNWKMVELENKYIRLAIMPEMGGKVWEAVEKSKDYPFVFTTKAVKFRDISLRGAWTTGGLEFNFGDIGHATTCATPVDYFIRRNSDGSVSCFTGATEWASGTTWRVEIRLDSNKAYFSTRSWWYNGTPFEQELYHWINAGFKADGDLEFIFPGTHYIGHGGEYNSWPVDSVGRDISFYRNNNFGSYKSYHIFGRPSDFYGGFWHNDNMGFGRYSPYYEKLGKKVWILGLSQEGARWENLLGDNDGLNVELQSGRLFNQASGSSMFTPFKHVGFDPYTTGSWTDYWFPVKETRGMTNASLRGALNLRIEKGWLKLDWMSLENQNDTLTVFNSGAPLLKKQISLKPMEVFRDSLVFSGKISGISVRLGSDLLTEDPSPAIDRPVGSPADFDWKSEYGLFMRGSDLSKQKNYGEAEEYFLKALEKNANLLPALDAMAQLRCRQGLYGEAKEYARKALSINTYDPWANFFWGLANEKTGSEVNASDGYSVASLDPATRSAALLRLAFHYIRTGNLNKAKVVVGKCLEANPSNEGALILRAIIERISGNITIARNYLDGILSANPLNHTARFEKYLITGSEADRNEFVNMIRQEMPWETFIEIAIHYNDLKRSGESLKVLGLAPEHPIVQIWQAWLLDKSGKRQESLNCIEKSLAASPELVFPFRPDMIPLFTWADSLEPSWKWRYYEALVRWQNNQDAAAKKLFSLCGSEPDFVPFYLAKARLFTGDSDTEEASLEKAYGMDPSFWRSGIELVRFYAGSGNSGKALDVALNNFKYHPESFIVGLQLAQMQKLNEKYHDALSTLRCLEMLPAEGDVNAHSLFRETNILLAIDLMKSKKLQKALFYLKEAEKWPENLFSGEPYLPDNRLTKFLMAYCESNLKNTSIANDLFSYIRDYKNPFGQKTRTGNLLTEKVTLGEKDFKTITVSLSNEPEGDSDHEILTKFLSVLK